MLTIGQRIRNKRKGNGLTLRNLSEKCKVSVSFLCDIEQDRRRPSLERLKDIAKALDISVSYLLGEDRTEELPGSDLYLREYQDAQFREVLEKIGDFDSWRQEDKEELLTYLTVKKKTRTGKTKKK